MTVVSRVEKHQKIELVALQSCNQAYCIDITFIREIRRWHTVTPLPNCDPGTLGVMNLRGLVIPILDLSACLGMPPTTIGDRSVVVVLGLDDRIVGVLVDIVSEILSIDKDAIQANPMRNSEDNVSSISGLVSIGDRMLKVLKVENLFDRHNEEVA